MSLRYVLERKVNCSQLLSKCRLLITFENSSSPTKCSAENASMCSLVSALAAREESDIHVIFQRLSATSDVR